MFLLHDLKLLGTEAGLDFEIKLDPDKRFYCLFGKNGVGKTNLLQNLGRLLLAEHSMLTDKVLEKKLRFDGKFRAAEVYPALKELRLCLSQEVIVGKIKVKEPGWAMTNLEKEYGRRNQTSILSAPRHDFVDGLPIDRPVIVIGTNGRGHTYNVSKQGLSFVGNTEQEFVKSYLRTWNATMAAELQTEGVAAWIAARLLVNPAFVVGHSNRADEVVALCELLSELDPIFKDYIVRPAHDVTHVQIYYRDGALWFGPTPIDKLATGYIAVVKIFQEIISAYGAWGGLIGAQDIRGLDGIVLIDELEAHLHPQWQVNLVPLLKRAFPNTTFIVCTHSPILVAQTEEGEAYELVRTGNQVVTQRLGSPRDWYLADVYSNAFHIDLPAPGTSRTTDEPTLNELMVSFSGQVKDYLKERNANLRGEALALGEKITARLPEDDPRRRSVASLRSLLG